MGFPSIVEPAYVLSIAVMSGGDMMSQLAGRHAAPSITLELFQAKSRDLE